MLRAECGGSIAHTTAWHVSQSGKLVHSTVCACTTVAPCNHYIHTMYGYMYVYSTLYWPELMSVHLCWVNSLYLSHCKNTPSFYITPLPSQLSHTPGFVFGAGESVEPSSLAQPPPPPPEPPSWHLWEGPHRTPGPLAACEGDENYQVLAHLPHWTPSRYVHVKLYHGHLQGILSVLHETKVRNRYDIDTVMARIL